MKWLKEIFVDIIVTISIIMAVFINIEWIEWVIIGYTAVLLLAKIIVLAGDSSLQLIRKTRTTAPVWFLHLLYGINTGVLLSAQWWFVAGAWILIWLLSYIAQQKLKITTGQQG